MQRFLSLVFTMGMTIVLWSQTYNGSSGTITANNTSYFNISVSGLNPENISQTFGLESVKVSLNSSDTHNLILILIAPNNTEVILTNQMSWGSQFINTYFNDNGIYFMNEGSGSYTGTFRPDENIGVVNNGQNANGYWKLKIINKNGTSGALNNWSIKFSNSPSLPVNFTTSDLPIVSINTYGLLIPDEPKIYAFMSIIDNPSGVNALTDTPTFTSHIGIETRGNSSQGVVKKSYGLTTQDGFGTDINVSIFGMPAEEDWVLIANYNDKTLFRNAMAYEMARRTGRYASRTQFCEVFINNQYRGVYHFGEKIKRDNERVDIAKLEPTEISGDNLTGGYILKIDKEDPGGEPGFISPYQPVNHPNGQVTKYLYVYPDAIDIVVEQKNYIESYVVGNFENALNSSQFTDPTLGYRPYMDEASFMDYFLINEIGKNVDGYRISTYLHKDKNGEIVMGPVWDFDLAFHNADYCDGYLYTGWAYEFPCDYDYYQPPYWWSRLFQDDLYAHDLHEKWVFYRQNIFSDASMNALIDQMSAEVTQAQARNFQKWSTLGRYIWPNPYPYATTHAEEVSSMRNWIMQRLHWMDDNLPNPVIIGIEETVQSRFQIYPNPIGNQQLIVKHTQQDAMDIVLEISQTNGMVIYKSILNTSGSSTVIPLENISAGLYICKISDSLGTESFKIIVEP
jgi:subtilisin-like proprotein convertase family protein